MISQPRAPPEILQAIVDHLGEDSLDEDDLGSWNALKACHLVSSSFRRRAIRYLFRRLNFPPNDNVENAEERQGKRLLEIIESGDVDEEEYQHLAPYVKEFSFVLNIDYLSELEDDYVPRLAVLFDRLSTPPFSIDSVHIEFCEYADVEWPSRNHHEFETSFIKLISSPSCRSVSLAHIDQVPLRVLLSGGNGIKQLKLRKIHFAEHRRDVTPSLSPTTIETDDLSSIVNLLCPGSAGGTTLSTDSSPPTLSLLQHLKLNSIINAEGTTLADLQKMVTLAGPSLKTLTLHFQAKYLNPLPPLDLSRSEGLQSVSLKTYIDDRGLRELYQFGSMRSMGTAVGFGGALLNISAPAKNLQTISILKSELFIATTADNNIIITADSQDKITSLSKALTADRYPKLKVLSFDFLVDSVFTERGDEADIMFNERKPLLEERIRSEFPDLLARNVDIKIFLTMEPPMPIGIPFR